MNIRIKSIIY